MGQLGTLGAQRPSDGPSARQTSHAFQGYIECIRRAIPVSKRVYFLSDMHVSHRTDDVEQLTQFLNIELHYIPAGATDKLQLLDPVIFSTLKSQEIPGQTAVQVPCRDKGHRSPYQNRGRRGYDTSMGGTNRGRRPGRLGL
jgi:hypothetical protein